MDKDDIIASFKAFGFLVIAALIMAVVLPVMIHYLLGWFTYWLPQQTINKPCVQWLMNGKIGCV